MSRLFLCTSLIGAAVLFGPVQVKAQPKQAAPDTVNILTVDGVRLKAQFYASSTAGAPTVIMLHPIGDGKSMKAPEWKNLAESLQKGGYSVITFDFRGHGDSTTIQEPDKFFNKPVNKLARVKDPKNPEIDVQEYIKNGANYLPVLVNDIAAVRAYIERRNDDRKDCNAASLIVVGADAGATLGALWINSEWHRFKYTPNPMAPLLIKAGTFATKAEGNDIIGAVFLTVAPKLETRSMKIESLLKIACKDNGMAAAFFFGKDDKSSATLAASLEKNLKPKKDSRKHEFIGKVELDTKLTGIKLLQKGLKTDKAIVDYLDLFAPERKYERVDREFKDTYYVWRIPAPLGAISLSKNKKGEQNLNFDDYLRFNAQ